MCASARPDWMTEELEEEWPASPSPPPEDSRAAFQSLSSKDGSIRIPKRVGTGSTRTLDYGDGRVGKGSAGSSTRSARPPSPPSPTTRARQDDQRERQADQASASPAAAAAGTMIVRTDVEDKPFNPLTPAKGAASKVKGGAGSGIKGLFSPLALEAMFEPPSPPNNQQDTTQSSQDAALVAETANLSLTSPSSSPVEPPSPLAPNGSPSPVSSYARPQQQHLPPRPSRLATAFGPDDLTQSTVDARQEDQEEDEDGAGSEDEIVESDIVGLGAFNGRKQSAGFEFSCPPQQQPRSAYSAQSRSPQSFGSFISPLRQNRSFADEDEEDDDEGEDTNHPTARTRQTTSAGRTSNSGRSSMNNTGYARNYGPPLSPVQGGSRSNVSAGSPQHESGPGQPKRLSLFTSQYDTFTNAVMTGMLEEIDHDGQPVDGSPLSTTSRSGGGSNESDSPTSSNPSDIPFRAVKRVKLSPQVRAVSGSSAGSSSSSSFDRLRRSRGGTSNGSASRPMRDWQKESGEMLRKLKEMGNGNPTGLARGGWGRGGSYSFSEREEGGSDAGGSTEDDAGGTVRRKLPTVKDADSPPTPTHSLPPTPPLQSRAQLTAAASNRPHIQPPSRQSAYVLESANVLARIHAIAPSDDSTSEATTSPVTSTIALPAVNAAPAVEQPGTRRVSNELPRRFPSIGRASRQPSAASASKEGKENDGPSRPPASASSTAGARIGSDKFEDLKAKAQSPRKLLRRLSAADEVDKEILASGDVSTVREEEEPEPTTRPSTFSLPLARPGRGAIPSRPTSQQTTRSSTTESTVRAPSSLRRAPPAASASAPAPAPAPVPAPADDLNRFVSSSTVLTTVGPSTISSASFIKHAGMPPARGRMISIPLAGAETPRVVGKMQYDQDKMIWVRVRDGGKTAEGGERSKCGSEEDDPFADMESTRGSGGIRALDEENENDDLDEAEATFISDAGQQPEQEQEQEQEQAQEPSVLVASPPREEPSPPARRPSPPTPLSALNLSRREFSRTNRTASYDSTAFGDAAEGDDDQEHDGFPVPANLTGDSLKSFQFPSSSSQSPPTPEPVPLPRPVVHHAHTAPPIVPNPAATSTPLPAHRPVGRIASGGGLRPFATPVSVLKKRSPGIDGQTPASAAHRRSVSFSDGRKAGKMKDLRVDEPAGGEGRLFEDRSVRSSSFMPSARGTRIQNMLEGLGDDDVTASIASLHEQTPSKGPQQPYSSRAYPTYPQESRRHEYEVETEQSEGNSTVLAGNMTGRSNGAGRSFHYGNGGRRGNPGDATFLTEWSFGATRDRLVEIITDVHPFVVNWEDMAEINLEGKGAGSVARLKEFLPKLVEINLNKNDLDYLSGLPTTVETLHVAFNRLSGLTAVAHLPNLQYLDISNNQLDVVHQLQCLRHLREVRLDNNAVTDLTPLFVMSGLTKISAAGNQLESIDFADARWSRLESLDLSRNKLESITGVHHLTSLTSLTLDDNLLRAFDSSHELPKLRSLKLSKNKLARLDAGQFPQLRTLYADNNRLQTINCSGRRTKLERLSLRSQETGQLALSHSDLRDVKRLFVSGNPLPTTFFNQSCHGLVYIEMAACKLSSLPPNFSSFAPNVRSLNLNYNFFSDVTNLGGLKHLTKLSVVGSRLEATKPVMRMLKTLPRLEMLDLRMNPCTLAMYLPLIINNIASALEPTQSSTSPQTSPTDAAFAASPPWTELDAAFRQSLPDVWYVRRLAHRGLVMQACPRVQNLDGVEISAGERRKAAELMEEVLHRNQSTKGEARG